MSIHLSLARHTNDNVEPLARCESRLLQFPTPVRNIETWRERVSSCQAECNARQWAIQRFGPLQHRSWCNNYYNPKKGHPHVCTGRPNGPEAIDDYFCHPFPDASHTFAFCAFPQLPHLVKYHLRQRWLNLASYLTYRMIDIQKIEIDRCVYDTSTAVSLCDGYH